LGLEPGQELAPPTQEQLTDYYIALLDTRKCLIGLGYEQPDAPSLDLFLDADESRSWHPYSLVAQLPLSVEEWAELEALCPQPSLYERLPSSSPGT
jgi:hypothetical protein